MNLVKAPAAQQNALRNAKGGGTAYLLGNYVLVDLDDKPDAPSEAELAEALGLPLCELQQAKYQWDDNGRSVHYLFAGSDDYGKNSALGALLPAVDVQTGKALIFVADRKTQATNFTPPPAPPVIREILASAAPVAALPQVSKPVTPSSLDYLKRCLSHIDPDLEYQQWAAVIAGTVDRFGHDQQAFDLLNKWSAGGCKYAGESDVSKHWRSYNAGGGVTFATVTALAREGGMGGVEAFKSWCRNNPVIHSSPLSEVRGMSICGQSQQMLASLERDVFALERLVLMNQITIFFAPPNSGKTLLTVHFLIEAAKQGDIDPTRVIYVNADDTPRGAATKASLFEQYKMNMLVPGHNGFHSDDLYPLIERLISANEARGVIIVMDTLRRFFNSMDHESTKVFGELSRRFINAGGTMLVLGHTNKNKSEAGKNRYEGTQGTVNDADAVYVLDVKSSKLNDDVTKYYVTFEASPEVGGKLRGDNELSASYSFVRYEKQTYNQLINSISKVSSSDAELTEVQRSVQSNVDNINYIEHLISKGISRRTELIKAIHDGCELSRSRATKLLDLHTGENWNNGHRWRVLKGDSEAPAAKLYQLLTNHRGCPPDKTGKLVKLELVPS
ncbi:PriCT-2 domain-containing protein [Neiella sp. HB171785]|uniref:PriCT-2 domain-containing protein n=1 Tax=Neiella litorisoli TaxID=2771431 RepID=A0A8J6QQ21_9GAMM|nr:PriCT-2 domain-containing protein [Neiella litorisoli]MBD1388429.1 PriCT-2 domain-containing protein [Neiella litorisoli]